MYNKENIKNWAVFCTVLTCVSSVFCPRFRNIHVKYKLSNFRFNSYNEIGGNIMCLYIVVFITLKVECKTFLGNLPP